MKGSKILKKIGLFMGFLTVSIFSYSEENFGIVPVYSLTDSFKSVSCEYDYEPYFDAAFNNQGASYDMLLGALYSVPIKTFSLQLFTSYDGSGLLKNNSYTAQNSRKMNTTLGVSAQIPLKQVQIGSGISYLNSSKTQTPGMTTGFSWDSFVQFEKNALAVAVLGDMTIIQSQKYSQGSALKLTPEMTWTVSKNYTLATLFSYQITDSNYQLNAVVSDSNWGDTIEYQPLVLLYHSTKHPFFSAVLETKFDWYNFRACMPMISVYNGEISRLGYSSFYTFEPAITLGKMIQSTYCFIELKDELSYPLISGRNLDTNETFDKKWENSVTVRLGASYYF